MSPRRLTLSLLIVASAGAAACTVDYDEVAASGHLDYWRPNVAGHALITKASKAGTGSATSLRRDLGIDHDDTPGGGVDLDLARSRISFEYLDLALQGSTKVPQSFIFHAQTYPAGDRVQARLDVPTARLDWRYAIVKDGSDVWRAGVGARFWTFDMKVQDAAAALNESRHFSHVYPLVATDVTHDLGGGLFARAAGDVALLSLRREVLELLAAAGYGSGRFSAELGWRYLRYDFNESTNDGDFQLSGPYVGVTVHF